MIDILYLYTSLLVALLAILYALRRYVYHSGLVDGYGASVEPDNPDYRDARIWLQENKAGEWPELIPVKRRVLRDLLNAKPATDWDVAKSVMEAQQEALERNGVAYMFLGSTGEERE